MALILNIDTAIDSASLCLAKDGDVLAMTRNEQQKDHAAWLHPSIKEIYEKNKIELRSTDAIAITAGPGSYTGLRIGMSAAKGICFALNIPLIALNTLAVMANEAKTLESDLLCPMIDARRMEVYTALYSKGLEVVGQPTAMVLHENSFDEELKTNTICFFGNGSIKFNRIKKHNNASFSDITTDATSMIAMSEDRFNKKEFADLAYTEPLYLKEFYTPVK